MKKEKPKFDEKKYIELCTKREMKMYELRKNGVPNLYVNGEKKFKRLMVKKIGYKRHIKDGIYEAVLFDEVPIEKDKIIFL